MSHPQQCSHELLNLLLEQQRTEKKCPAISCAGCYHHPKQKIEQAIKEQRQLTLILPAFPAKSANREKTLSAKPDRGELLGLINLNQLCQKMTAIYAPGVKLIICSDGRVFNDLVLVNDADVDLYQKGIQHIIHQQQLTHLSTFTLDEVYPTLNYTTMRNRLMGEFAQPLAALKQQILENESQRYQFNGIHRFIIEDQLALKPHQSKSQIRREAKEVAYQVIRRSNAWSCLLNQYFSNAVRLSIHPQLCGSEKIGIQFLPASNCWSTPWHNVLLKSNQGWQLIKRKEAENLGARLNDDHYILEAYS